MVERIKNNFYKRLNLYRKIFQIFSLAFLIAVPLLVVNEIYTIIGNLYSITIADVDIVDPAMSLQTMLLSREVIEVLLIGLIIPVLLALIFGKVFCSWMCPFNTLSEYWQKLTRKLFKKRYRKAKLKVRDKNPEPVYFWAILIFFFVLSLILDFPLITFLSAPGIISSEISHVIMGMGFGLEIIIVLAIIVIEGLIFKRYWCKFICPVGGILSVFRFKRTLHLVYNENVCSCAAVSEPCCYSCPLDLSPKRKNLYPFCYNCGECIKICEKTGSGALTFSSGIESANSKNVVSYSQKEEKEVIIEE
jgi:ferredoxin-type protein NapH